MTDPQPPTGGEESAPREHGLRALLRRVLPAHPWQRAVIALFGLLAAGVLAVAVVALVLTPTLPELDDLSEKRLKVPMRVYTADGQLLAEFGEEKRIPVKIDEVPDLLIKAILAAEDHSFFSHQGVDYLGFVRAAWANFRAGTHSQGASTITMQVARNYFLSPEKTYTRKIREVLLSFKIERELSKMEILERYVNKIFLGHRAYGFAAAAQIYYGKQLSELSLAETAMLAGLPKAPSRDNPLTNPQNATERRNYILKHMLALGFIDETQYREAVNAPQTAVKHAVRFVVDAPHIAEMVRQYMLERYDESTYAGGFHVYTTIRTSDQNSANRALRKGILDYDRRHGWRGPAGHASWRGEPDRAHLDDVLKDYREVGGLVPAVVLRREDKSFTAYTREGAMATVGWGGLAWARRYHDENSAGSAPETASDIVKIGDVVYLEPLESSVAREEAGGEWRLAQVPEVEGALLAVRPGDGAILALAGGFDFYNSSFNRVVQAERQPGSALKPFLYTAALEKGFTPATTVSGAPIVIDDVSLEDEWRPEDYSRQFYGPTRLRKALALSLNLVSVRLLRAIGPGYAVDYLGRFGFEAARLPKDLSLALGTASATPLAMTRAYAVYANGGSRVEPYFIQRVEDSDHKVLEETQPATPVAALSPEVSFLATSMMQDVIREGTGRAAQALGRKDLAGKTGTTNDYRDAWFCGFNHELTACSWIGFDQNTSLGRGETGGRAALPMWVEFMRESLAGVPERPLAPPEGVEIKLVNVESGEPTDASDPGAMEEFFLKDTAVAGEKAAPQSEGKDSKPARAPAADSGAENVRQQLF
jgi:penicillin-binding protein 1A